MHHARLRHPIPPALNQMFARRRCLVCGMPLAPSQGHDSHACDRCQPHYAHIHRFRQHNQPRLAGRIGKEIPRCWICNWPLTPSEMEQNTPADVALNMVACADPACGQEAGQRKAEQAHRLKLMRVEIEKRRQEWLTELRAQLELERNEMLQAQNWPLLLLPGNSRSLMPVGEERRTALRNHLRKTIEDTPYECVPQSPASESATEQTAFAELAIAACTLCGGNCCTNGGNRAYINDETIRQYRTAFPHQTAEEIEKAFLARIPERAFEDSCIYHGGEGCSLDEWRGPVCRGHFCHPLKEAQAEGMERAWGVSLTAGEPHWSHWPWPREDDEILAWSPLGG